MSQSVADFVVDRLHEWNIRRIYGYPGDGINGMLGALERATDKVRFIQTRHEELASFMACANAKYTGGLGVCLATSGPGAIHLLNGLYDAKKDHTPVVAIVGQQKLTALGADYQQEVDLISLFKDVANHYVQMCSTPAQARQLIDQACRISIANKEVTCVILPNDVQEMDYEDPPHAHGSTFTGVGYSPPEIIPRKADLEHAAGVLNEGERVGILVGAGALHASKQVRQVAEKLGAGVAKSCLGKAVIPDDVPYCTGGIGLLGTKPSWDMMMNCDTLLMIGSSFPYAEFLPPEGSARGVQIDIKPRSLNLRYPMEAPLHGDAKLTLQALLPYLAAKKNRDWQERLIKERQKWDTLIAERAFQEADPINPHRVCQEASPRLPDHAIISADSGSAANWFMRNLMLREGMLASLSGGLATMCPGVPYAVAAKFAFPERASIAFVGDGAMQMLGNNGLLTIARHWKEWEDPRLVIAVFNNGDLNQVTWEQRVMSGDPVFPESQDVPPFNFAQYGALCGLKGIRVENPERIGEAWDKALSADRPCILDFVVDPNVPPLPPHITFAQAKGFLSSMLKGDRDALGVTRQSMKQTLQGFIPGRGGGVI